MTRCSGLRRAPARVALGMASALGLVPASQLGAQSYEERQLLDGVVRLEVERFGESDDVGTGIVIGVEGNTAYVLTALHVIAGPEDERRASRWQRRIDEIDILVQFMGDDVRVPGRLFDRWSEELDAAVVLVESPRVRDRGIAVAFGLGSPETLQPPYPALAIGHGGAEDWALHATQVRSASNPVIRFPEGRIGPGFSGGALLDTSRNVLVGMITRVGEAVSMDAVVANLNDWRVPHHLRHTRVSAPMVRVPSGPVVATPGTGGFGGATGELDAFFIDKYEVTVGQFRQFVADAGYSYEPGVRTCNYAVPERDAWPMNCVTWEDADAFARWAGKELPTEAQWERAAMGATGRPYPWGTTPPAAGDAALEIEWPVAVGSHQLDRSPAGAMDMLGNVSEWVSDWYRRNRTEYLGGRNPTGPPSGQDRVIRGPSYDTPLTRAQLTLRKRDLPDFGRTRFDYGFRCVLNEAANRE